METYLAERSEILRASRKDDEFLDDLQAQISELVKRIGSDAIWIRAYKYFVPATKLIYHMATSLLDAQTLGEEYLGLVQVQNQSPVELPSIWRRLLWAVSESCGPLALERKLEEWKQRDELYYQRRSSTDRVPLGRTIGSVLLRHLTMGAIQRLHWALFYLAASRFFSVWKRVAGIKYVTVRPQSDVKMNLIFKLIGASFLIQFLLSIGFAVRKDILRMRMLRMEPDKKQNNGKVS
jgi:peroxin-10